jgi:hypothetical protein
MKSLLVGTRHYHCKVCNCHDTCAYGYKQSEILSRLVGLGWEWYCFGLACGESYDFMLLAFCFDFNECFSFGM